MRAHLLVLLAAPLYAQSVSIGGKIGVPFNDPLGRWAQSKYFLLGPSVELQLPANFALEASALYRRVGWDAAYSMPGGAPTFVETRLRGNAWEFPLVGKYYFRDRERRWQPFLGTGWTLRTIGLSFKGTTTTTGPTGDRTVTSSESTGRSGLNVGATAVAGVRLRVGRFSLLPEVRYTRWGSGDGAFRRNDAGFFLGFRF